METKVSNFFLTDEINSMYGGMMVALPPEEWQVFQTMSLPKFAAQLRHWASTADLDNYPKHPRGPNKPKSKRPDAQFHHVATAKLLEQQPRKRARVGLVIDNECIGRLRHVRSNRRNRVSISSHLAPRLLYRANRLDQSFVPSSFSIF